MSRDKADLHAELQQAYDKACAEWKRLYPSDVQPFLTCTYRTNQEQNELYEIGRDKPGKVVTNAKAGESPHNYLPSFAFDIAFVGLNKKLSWDRKHFAKFADIIKKQSPTVEWGGDWTFQDPPHFQLKIWSKKQL